MKKWLVIQTRSRWEKKVLTGLRAKGIEVFCPLNKVFRRWSDRIKLLDEPLFKNVLFVKIAEAEKPLVRTTPGVVNFLYRNGRLCSVKDKQVQNLKAFLDTYENVEVKCLELNGHDVPEAKAKAVEEKRKSTKFEFDHRSYLIVESGKQIIQAAQRKVYDQVS